MSLPVYGPAVSIGVPGAAGELLRLGEAQDRSAVGVGEVVSEDQAAIGRPQVLGRIGSVDQFAPDPCAGSVLALAVSEVKAALDQSPVGRVARRELEFGGAGFEGRVLESGVA